MKSNATKADNELSTVKDRLNHYLSEKQITKSQFCRNIGVSAAYIQAMRNSISPEKLESISKNYPDLNLEWLLTGEGSMFKDTKKESFDTILSIFAVAGLRSIFSRLVEALDEIEELGGDIKGSFFGILGNHTETIVGLEKLDEALREFSKSIKK